MMPSGAGWGDTGVGDYEANPTRYVSRYGANYFHEDIADTFAVFVLGDVPQGDTVAEEKLRFFWADPDMTALRTAIRQDLGLDWPEETPSTAPAPEQPETGAPAVASLEELREELTRAIAAAEQPPAFDVSALERQEELPLTVKNLYYGILSGNRTYSYAYDLNAGGGGGRPAPLHHLLYALPHRGLPGGLPGDGGGLLASLVQTARDGLAQESIPIRITDPRAGGGRHEPGPPAGGGELPPLPAQPGRDGRHGDAPGRADPPAGPGPAGGAGRPGGADLWGDGHPRDGRRKQAEALYAYLTEHVRYDFRYYGEPGEMPYDSTTAFGALHDNLAICGGYAQAFQLLLEQAGIPCVTVSGKLGAENHMWDLARIDGQWLYFDPTSDRGRAAYGFQCFGVEAGSLKGHTWDQAWPPPWPSGCSPPRNRLNRPCENRQIFPRDRGGIGAKMNLTNGRGPTIILPANPV